jgi:L-2-hydroxyglutarate oxidase
MREIEPHAAGIAALRVPEEGIVDYPGVCQALRRQIEAAGGRVLCQAPALALHWRGGAWIAETPAGEQEGAFLLTCAGLQADRVARMAGEKPDVLIVPFRGDYYRLRADRTSLVRHLIYPVADPRFPFLGVHLTRRIHGGIYAGPNAVLALKREGYGKADFAWNDAVEALSFPGLWRFIRKYPSIAAGEVRRAFSPALFARALQTLVPELREDDLVNPHAGVRAQAMRADGSLVDDFVLLERPNALHVLNAPSPAATASLAIGEVIASRVNLT